MRFNTECIDLSLTQILSIFRSEDEVHAFLAGRNISSEEVCRTKALCVYSKKGSSRLIILTDNLFFQELPSIYVGSSPIVASICKPLFIQSTENEKGKQTAYVSQRW